MFNVCYIKSKVINARISIMGVLILCLLADCNSNNTKRIEAPKQEAQHSEMPAMMGDTNKNMGNMHMGEEDRSSHNARDEKLKDTSSTYWNTLPTNRTVISGQQAITPIISDMNFSFNGNGYIAFDYRRNRKVAMRVGGRIERLFVKYNYQYVHKGEKILEIYSPELNTYLEEYLFVKQQSNDTALLDKARQKLLLLGLTAAQIKQVDQTKSANLTVPIYSPYEGYVLFNSSESFSSDAMDNGANVMGGKGTGMNNAPTGSPSGTATKLSDNTVREGMYVSKGQTLFWINDCKEVWGIIAFTKETERYVTKGTTAIVQSELMPEQSIRTSVQFIEQVYQAGQKFTQARVYLANARGILKQNSLIKVTVTLPVKSLMIPASSVYYLGNVSIVWVRTGITKDGNNIFQSRMVKTGHRSGDEIEILEGLKQEENIAKDAGYLADSETIITY
jgi:membrane fusion protein, copper/silver efflux system